MSRHQVIALWVGIVAVVVMLLFPPIRRSGPSGRFYGYRFIGKNSDGVVDAARLTLGLLAVTAIAGGLLVTNWQGPNSASEYPRMPGRSNSTAGRPHFLLPLCCLLFVGLLAVSGIALSLRAQAFQLYDQVVHLRSAQQEIKDAMPAVRTDFDKLKNRVADFDDGATNWQEIVSDVKIETDEMEDSLSALESSAD